MTNRLVISAGVMKLSKIGQNVLTATPDNLQWSTEFPGGAKFIRGFVASSRSGLGTTNDTILFGKTFSAPPMVFAYVINTSSGSDGGDWPNQGWQNHGLNDSSTPSGRFSFSWTTFKVDSQVDRVIFSMFSAQSSFSYIVHYAILDYRFGL